MAIKGETMKSINLIFGCHSHQPVGNFDFVFEDAYNKSYKPFVDVLERYPDVRVTMHYTGPLWDWFAKHQPAYIKRLAKLVRVGQVEIMGGGYYEPLLCAIPERDAIAQIQRMQRFTEKHFGAPARGMWLTERVWEPQMARILSKAGVEYTALDDTHFLCSGLKPEDMFGYYMTEDEGHTLKVFPILEKLRYLIPFHQVHESIDFLREHATEDGMRCAVIHDDGEKFGVWPGTYDSVYTEGWLEELFQALTDNKDWLHSLRYSDYLDKAKALGRTYITCASYQEMMAWALPSDLQRHLHQALETLKHDDYLRERFGLFVRGGFWRSFLSKYAESNNMQKRMLRLSKRLASLREEGNKALALDVAESLLHQSQCNCAYWHGVFGGLYLNHLRSAIYEKIVQADAVLDTVTGLGAKDVLVEAQDFDGDGNWEGILENNHLALFFSPTDGGTLFELDFKDKPFNLNNTLTRRDEPYHDALRSGNIVVGDIADGDQSIHDLNQAKEAGLEKHLVADPYRRVSMRDLVSPETLETEDLLQARHPNWGGFATAAYSLEKLENGLRMQHTAALDESVDLRIEKTVALAPDASSFEIRYDLLLTGDAPQLLTFGVEFSANFLTGDAVDRYYESDDWERGRVSLGETGHEAELSHLALGDDWQGLKLDFRFDAPAEIHRFALYTVSQSEGGLERVYQGSVVTPCWRIELSPGVSWSRKLRVAVLHTPQDSE
jgi:4-alpha-glucanotransferase